MFRFLYRQRRRLLFGGFFAALGAFLFLSSNLAHLDVGVPWITVVAIGLTILICAMVYMAIAAVYITLFPRWRQLVELFPLGFLLNSLAGMAFPTLLGPESETVLGSLSFFAIWMLLYSLTYGTLLDRFPITLDWTSQRSFTSDRSAEALWAELVPGEAPPEAHWDKLLREFEADPEDPDSYELSYTHGVGLFQQQTITFLERTPHTFAKYYFVSDVDPRNKALTEGTHSVRIDPRPDGSNRVTLHEENSALLPRVALLMWFDDALGDCTDHIRAGHAGKRDWSMSGLYRRSVLALS